MGCHIESLRRLSVSLASSNCFQVFVGVFGSSGNLVANDWKRGESSSSQLDWTFGQLEVTVSGRVVFKTSFFESQTWVS